MFFLFNIIRFALLLTPVALFAAAEEETIGDLAMNVAANLPPYSSMITAFAYIMGLGFMISGMMKLKRHMENPQQVPLLAPVIFTAMGVLLVYLPTTITMLRDTFFESQSTMTGMDIYSRGTTMDKASVI